MFQFLEQVRRITFGVQKSVWQWWEQINNTLIVHYLRL